MADNQANYSKIGFTILLGVAATVAVLIAFGKMGSKGKEILAETYFHNPVSGLAPGSDVNFRGVKVGFVKRVSFIGLEYDHFAPGDGEAIWVEMAFIPAMFGVREGEREPEVHIRKVVAQGLRATVEANILTGISHIELDVPKGAVKENTCSWHPRHILIPPQPTLLQNAQETLSIVLAKLEKIDFAASWSNVLETVTALRDLSHSADTLLDTQQGNVSEILSNVRDATSSFRDLADQLKNNPSLLIRANDPDPLKETER